MPCNPHIPSISCFFLLDLVVSSTSGPCLYFINYLSPSFVEKFLFLLRIYLLMSPIRSTWYPLLFQMFTFSKSFDRKAIMGYSCLLRSEKLVKRWAYNYPGPPSSVDGTGMWKVIMHIEASPLPLNCCHGHLPISELSIPDCTLLPMRFPVVRLEVPRYYSCLLTSRMFLTRRFTWRVFLLCIMKPTLEVSGHV